MSVTRRAPSPIEPVRGRMRLARGVCECCFDMHGSMSRYFGVVACSDCERGLYRAAIILRDQGEAALLELLNDDGLTGAAPPAAQDLSNSLSRSPAGAALVAL